MARLSITLLLLGALFGGQRETTLLYPPFVHSWGIHRGTERELDMLLDNQTDFDNPQGLAVTKLISWDDPNDPDDDAEVTVFGVNSGRGEIIYNTSMYTLGLYGRRGSGKGEFLNPHGICATPEGDVYVVDTGNHRIVHLHIPKTRLRWIKTFGETLLVHPFDVAYTPDGLLYVTDADRNSVVVFDTSGNFVAEFGGLISPRGIDVDADCMRWSAYRRNFIVVADSGGKRLIKLDRRTGATLGSVSLPELGIPNADVQYIALDYLDNVYAVDSVRCQVHKFDKDLNYLVSVGECGEGEEKFDRPRGIAIWRRFGQIFISERTGAQYFWVGVDVHNLKVETDKERGEIKLSFLLTEEAYVAPLLKRKGKEWKLWHKRKFRLKCGERTLTLKLPEDLPPGKYKLEITFEATYSSKGHFAKRITRTIRL